MFVKDRMSTTPFIVGAKEPATLAVELMLEKNVRHLPVADAKGKLVGVVSYADIMHALPTTIHDLQSGNDVSIRNIKIKDVLPPRQKVISCTPDTCLEEAALIMRSYKIGSLPVLDPEGKIVGMITKTDIFDAFIDLLGVRSAGVRLNIIAEDKPGRLAEIASIIKSYDANITRLAAMPTGNGRLMNIVRLKTDRLPEIRQALQNHGYEVESSADYRHKLKESQKK